MSERLPKQEILDTHDRFMDYCGNALNGLSGNFDNYLEHIYPDETVARGRIQESWDEFFRRVDAFIESDFVPTNSINKAALEHILTLRNKDILTEGQQLLNELFTAYEKISQREPVPDVHEQPSNKFLKKEGADAANWLSERGLYNPETQSPPSEILTLRLTEANLLILKDTGKTISLSTLGQLGISPENIDLSAMHDHEGSTDPIGLVIKNADSVEVVWVIKY